MIRSGNDPAPVDRGFKDSSETLREEKFAKRIDRFERISQMVVDSRG